MANQALVIAAILPVPFDCGFQGTPASCFHCICVFGKGVRDESVHFTLQVCSCAFIGIQLLCGGTEPVCDVKNACWKMISKSAQGHNIVACFFKRLKSIKQHI